MQLTAAHTSADEAKLREDALWRSAEEAKGAHALLVKEIADLKPELKPLGGVVSQLLALLPALELPAMEALSGSSQVS